MVPEPHRDPGLLEDIMPAEDDKINDASTELDELQSNGAACLSAGPSPLGSLSRSLQRAEGLLRSSLNPGLRWLLRRSSEEKESGAEEGSFVAAHNLVSRSSARIWRLQQGMLGMAAQRPLVRGPDALPQVCVRGSSPEGCVLQRLSGPPQQAACRALWRLMEQRSQLLFVHEYARRAAAAAAYGSKLALLEERWRGPERPLDLNTGGVCPLELGPLCQELRTHLKHWACLSEKLRADPFARRALAPHAAVLVEMKRTLDALALQALVLMERCVHALWSGLAQTDLESVAAEVLEAVLWATEQFNQLLEEEQRGLSGPLRGRLLLHRTWYSGLPVARAALGGGGGGGGGASRPAALQAQELLSLLAVHHGRAAARELHGRAAGRRDPERHSRLGTPRPRQDRRHAQPSVTPEWTWERLEHNYLPPRGSPPPLHSRPAARSADRSSESSSFCSSPCRLSERRRGSGAEPAPQRPRGAGPGAPGGSVPEPPLGRRVPGQRSPGGGPGVPVGPDPAARRSAVGPLWAFCKEDQFSLELLFQALVCSSDRLSPLGPPTPRPGSGASRPGSGAPTPRPGSGAPRPGSGAPASCPPGQRTPEEGRAACRHTDSAVSHGDGTGVRPAADGWFGLEQSSERVARCGAVCATALEEEGGGGGGGGGRAEWFQRPRSVRWLDLSQSSVCADLWAVYRSLLWTACGQALWHYLHFPPGGAADSLNLWSDHQKCRLLRTWRHASTTGLVPQECGAMLEKVCLRLLILTTHTHWDQVLCGSLGSGLKDKCVPGSGGRPLLVTSPEQEGSLVTTATVKHLLRLSPPLLSALRCHLSAEAVETGCGGPSSRALCRATAQLAAAAVQASLLWVMSRSYQFLSSWSLDRFLLVTQGDLKVLRVSLERLLQQMETLLVAGAPPLHRHHRALLRQQVVGIRSCVSELQAFSSVALKIFSSGCKQMSGELFEQTMPSAKHWRLNYRTEFPSSPSEYVLFAAQSVIGQVLEGVAPLSDDARVQTLSITTTAFMEAWMEHILKQKIRFSVQGALQLKQDFDCIRGFLQSDELSSSADLLHLRVFQQMDSAVVCLLQQPQPKPYLHWRPFTRCCPTARSGSSIDVAIGGSITNLENMEGEVLTPSSSSPLTPDAPTAPPLSPSQTYLAPSLALGAVQQEWLDLRIHNSASRWRLPGLQCLSKSEH